MSLESQSSSAARTADARSAVVRELAKKLRQTERSQQPESALLADVDAFANRKRAACISTGIEPLDQLLPDGGFLKGTIVEWVCDEIGSGAQTLAMLSAAKILRHRVDSAEILSRATMSDSSIRHNLFVIDPAEEFYPVAATRLGVDLNRTVVVRPGDTRSVVESGGVQSQALSKSRASRNNEVLWALEQALRSKAVGLTMCAIDHLNGHTFRRLQLAAETGGGLCFLRRPLAAIRQPTWADVRLLVKSASPLSATATDHGVTDSRSGWEKKADEKRPTGADCHLRAVARINPPVAAVRRMTVELLKCRSGLTGGRVELDYHDETNDVRVAAELARPAATQRSARA